MLVLIIVTLKFTYANNISFSFPLFTQQYCIQTLKIIYWKWVLYRWSPLFDPIDPAVTPDSGNTISSEVRTLVWTSALPIYVTNFDLHFFLGIIKHLFILKIKFNKSKVDIIVVNLREITNLNKIPKQKLNEYVYIKWQCNNCLSILNLKKRRFLYSFLEIISTYFRNIPFLNSLFQLPFFCF